ncbi:hypothetical protein [Sinorhizobium fredii]|uniref:hypothetical protein n=1 Tax=Rhizobium fredii TaxID=380 RepID=UPI003399FCB0
MVYLGRRADASRWIGRALAIDPDDPIVLYNAASVSVLLGKHDGAMSFLERYARVTDRKTAAALLAHDREFESLKHLPRFRALI